MGNSKPPSRERYEEENPVVSFRISREKKAKLDSMMEDFDLTKKAWFESVIDETEQDYAAVREEAHETGYQEAKEKYAVSVPCAECGSPMSLTKRGEDHLWDLLERLSEAGSFTSTPPPETMAEFAWTLKCPNCAESTN